MKAIPFILMLALPLAACSHEPEIMNRQETEKPSAPDISYESDNDNNFMKIKMTIDGRIITATMIDNAAAKDFIARLPLEVELEDYNRTEKIFYPSPKLNIDGVKRGCTPASGDITIYAPWGNVAIFYKSWPQSSELIRIGKIDGDSIKVLNSTGNIKVKIEKESNE